MSASDAIVVLVTAPTPEQAATLGRTLVEERLCACANLIPGVRSIYRWTGEISDEAEVLLLLKSRAPLFARLQARIVELHPYDCPEVLQLDVAAGAAPYLAWLAANVRAAP